MEPGSLNGINIIETRALPIYPDHKEDARRIAKHRLRKWVEYIGEEVGPAPGEPTHALIIGNNLYASLAFVRRIRLGTETSRNSQG